MPFDTTDTQDTPHETDTGPEAADAPNTEFGSIGQRSMQGEYDGEAQDDGAAEDERSDSLDPPPGHRPRPSGGEKEQVQTIEARDVGKIEQEPNDIPVNFEGRLSRR